VIADRSLVVGGVSGILLETDLLRLTLFPDAGAKILDLVHRRSGENLLWQNPRVPLARTYPGPAFDDVWCGGWDELFPTDAACAIGQNTFPDHGDLWCGPWSWSLADDGDRATVTLRRYGVSLPCLMEKSVTMRQGSLDVEFRHRLTNLGSQPLEFAWSLHVAQAVDPGSRIVLPDCALQVVEGWEGRFRSRPQPLAPADAATVAPPDAGLTEWLYTVGASDGRCEVVHPARGIGLRLAFDPHVFRTTWLYGGWRGHYVLLTEPSTSPPGGLAQNVAEGTAASLPAGEELETAVIASVLET
jgi:hypothetical protein